MAKSKKQSGQDAPRVGDSPPSAPRIDRPKKGAGRGGQAATKRTPKVGKKDVGRGGGKDLH